MSHSGEKLCISEAEHVFYCRGKDLSVLAMLTSTALKEKKKKRNTLKMDAAWRTCLKWKKAFIQVVWSLRYFGCFFAKRRFHSL